jgi:hypothetical protein
MSEEMDRREFLRRSAVSAAAVTMTGTMLAAPAPATAIKLGFVGIGGRGSYHLDCALGMEGVEVVALCDIDDKALYNGKRWVEEAGQPTPHLYGESRTAFRQLCEQDTLDCVICCTPWEYHAPVCVAAMRNGKHAVSEVPIIVTLEEAWEVVETHEKTGKWATLGLEGFGDLTLMNLVRQGVLGEVLHAEGGYVHDLRMVQYNPLQEPWRLNHSLTRNGNLYPDHPMARILRLLDINHGDRFDTLVSMSTKSLSLARYARLKYGENGPYANAKFAQGDVNITLLHTAGGKVCTLNFDTSTPHPREFFRLQCVKGVYQTGVSLPAPRNPGAGARGPGGGRGGIIYLEGRSPEEDLWESAEPYFKEFEHPFLKGHKPKPRKTALRGHGGGGSVTPVSWERLVAALRAGTMPDWDVYDSVTSSAISPLSEKSVAGGSAPISFPDFTKGKWQTAKPYDIV